MINNSEEFVNETISDIRGNLDLDDYSQLAYNKDIKTDSTQFEVACQTESQHPSSD